jgi:hypothetical protein
MADHHQHHHVAVHDTPDDQYRETPIGAGHEHTDANIWIIAKFLFWLIVAAVIIHFGLALLFGLFVEQRVANVDPRYPLATAEGERVPPEPRLQRFPREDILRLRTGEENVLNNYGWVDQKAGTVHIPIQDAMRLVLERRMLKARETTTTPDSGLIPADSSAGRTYERRR